MMLGIYNQHRRLVLLVAAMLLAGCADPRLPTGGPPDQTPPALEATVPDAEATNFGGEAVQLTFTEYVDQASFARALSVTPEPEGRLRFKWRRRRVEIRFPEPLRDNTTYVLTLDANLRDARGVALANPITFAFSTGPQINRGQLRGRLIEPRQGSGVAGYDVFAYAAPDGAVPDSLPERPAYRTQTGEDGRFALTFLSEQPYYVVALQDRNRNRQPDATEPFAVPPRPAIRARADTTDAASLAPWIVATRDTVPPVLQQVRPRSSRRLLLRFSEPVLLMRLDPDGWLLEDSAASRPVRVEAVYRFADDPRQVYLRTDSLAETPHRLRPAPAVADSSGNPVRADTFRFTPGATPDTLRLRFAGFVPAEATELPPGLAPGVRFNEPIAPPRLAEVIAAQDTSGQARPFEATTTDGVTYRLRFTPALAPGNPVVLRVDGQRAGGIDTVYTRTFERLPDRELGNLSGIVAAPDTGGPLILELYATGQPEAPAPYAVATPDSTGAFAFEALPEGPYRLRLFLDLNGNGRWDGGQILPYRPAEPIAWNTEPASVRARWDSALGDTLRVGFER